MITAPHLSPEQQAELEAYEQRSLSPQEFEARVRAPWSEQEKEDFDGLVSWFRRRYPTPLARLQATRHLLSQWRRSSGS